MKCSNCGSESQNKICEYCGTEIPPEQPQVDDNIGKCPKCGSSNIDFEREKVATERQYRSRKNYVGSGRHGKSVSQSTYRTIGVCQHCGYTWNPNANKSKSNSKTWLWVLGWILIFPVPLTILLLRKQDMKPAVKYGIMAVAWILFLVIALSGGTGTEGSQVDNPSYNQSTTSGTNNQTESLDTILNNYVGEIVSEFNSKSSEKLTFVENFTPSDKNSGHYRTEFRLTAYKDAVGKSYKLGGKVVDIVVHGNAYGDSITCRIYTNDTSLSQVINLINIFSPILDSSMTASELQNAITEVSTKKYANGYYFGDLGITLSGTDTKGYELMLKTD